MLSSITVNLGALRRNATRLRALTAPAKFAVVVKANAYGHGLIPVTRALRDIADLVCVYSLDEAITIRAAELDVPVLIMGPVELHRLEEAIGCGAAIALWDRGAFASEAARTAQHRGTRLDVHVKINTGVARLGIEPSDAAAEIERYLTMPGLRVAGVFTHLAAAEELEALFTDAQIHRLHEALEPIEARLAETGTLWHAAASAAAMMWPQTRLHMVRVGIALYGLWPSAPTQTVMERRIVLEPALSWTSRLVQIRPIEAGVPVGYGRTYHSERRTTIGVVPVGYSDGVPRALSNTGEVIVGGRRCPIVGRVCMNMFMIDLGPDAQETTGSAVTLIGSSGTQTITVEEWAAWAGTINYEIVARLADHLPRTFVDR